MKVTIYGSGYVGLVTGTCFAERGHDVLCVDIDEAKINKLLQGQSPIFEPGLDELLQKNIKEGRLNFTTDLKAGVDFGLFQFIAVGTPPDEDGSADLQYVLSVAKTVGQHMNEYKIIVDKSTVPVGTADKVKVAIASELKNRNLNQEFDVVSNPEFLKEGDAIVDFMQPDRIVVGVDTQKALDNLYELYKPFLASDEQFVTMDIRSAELTKYASNAMLATKISFINEMSQIAEHVHADIALVCKGMSMDRRIGGHFINPGPGYGGSCFPKDVNALVRTSEASGYPPTLLNAVEEVNAKQKLAVFEKMNRHYNGDLTNKTFAVWGLSFKANTDDMRESPSKVLVEALWRAGANVRAYDPQAMHEAQRIWGERADLTLFENANDCLSNADALIIMTEWNEFKTIDFNNVKSQLLEPVIFDGRNLHDPQELQQLGFKYFAMGRGENVYAEEII